MLDKTYSETLSTLRTTQYRSKFSCKTNEPPDMAQPYVKRDATNATSACSVDKKELFIPLSKLDLLFLASFYIFLFLERKHRPFKRSF